MNKPKPYERIPGESNKAFAAFNCFLHLGPDRSIFKTHKKLSKNTKTLGDWSAKYSWQERAKAFDDDQAAIAAQAMEAEQKKRAAEWAKREAGYREERWQVATLLLKKARGLLRKKLSPHRWNLSQVARMIDVGDKLAALATGQETGHLAITGKEDSPPVATSFGTVLVLPAKETLDVVKS